MRDTSEAVAAVMPEAMDNFLVFWRIAAECFGGAVEEGDGLTMIATGLPVPFFNPAVIRIWPDDPVVMVAKVRDFAGRHGCMSMFSVSGEMATRFAPVARQLALIDNGTTPEMLMFRDDQKRVAAVDGLSIEVVTTEDLQRAFAEAVAASYAMPREMVGGFEHPILISTPGLTCYVGFIDGQPIATSMLLETGAIAGVHVVGTAPAYRRRGIGAVMTQRCVEDGWAHGRTLAALQSSSIGYPVYERIGFRRVTDIQGWRVA